MDWYAKGSGRDHSDLGSEEAAAFCRGHGLSAYDTALVAWLVSNHLVMSSTSQRQDIYDPIVLQQFAEVVGDQTRLDYLFLLTIADIRGTNSQLWTSWKRTLIFDLYAGTRRALQTRTEAPRMRSERAAEHHGARALAHAADGGGVGGQGATGAVGEEHHGDVGGGVQHHRDQPEQDELRRHGVPYVTAAGTGFFDREEVKDVLALLRLVADPMDDCALARVLQLGLRRR